MDAQLLTVMRCLMEEGKEGALTIKDISKLSRSAYADEHDRQITNHWVGYIVRRRLNVATEKRRGNFVIPASERAKLDVLFERYGVTKEDAAALKARLSEMRSGLQDSGTLKRQPVEGE